MTTDGASPCGPSGWAVGRFFDAGVSDAKLKSIQISGSGDLAYEIGEYSAMMPQPSGGTAPGTGKYLVVFERQQDGNLMAADMFSPNA